MAGESARDVAARSRAKAERLMRHAEMYERGAEGEARTAGVLASLPPEWTTLHDLRWPGRRLANIDHVVLGPGGVFVIDSKNWSGRVEVIQNVLRQNGRSREPAVAGCADSALAVSELLGPFASYVAPVLCLVSDEPVSGWVRDVMICSTATLPQMLLTRPSVLTPSQLAEVWARLQLELRSAQGGPTVPGDRTPAAEHRARPTRSRAAASARSRRKSRPGSSLVHFAASVLMVLALAAFGPKLATVVGGIVSGQLTRSVVDHQACSTPTQAHTGKSTGHAKRSQRQTAAADARPTC